MEYIVLFIIILIIVLLIIQSNTFSAIKIKTSPLNLDYKSNKKQYKSNKKQYKSNKKQYKSSKKQYKSSKTDKAYGVALKDASRRKVNLLDKSDISSCSVSKEYKNSIGPDVKKEKNVYFLGDAKDSQLYHVFNNIYTFKEAEKTCIDRKGRLATVDELAEGLNKGADWCSWGWASDGRAYMPNKNPKCNKDTGLLSAKNIDPFLRLGTNCYGVPL